MIIIQSTNLFLSGELSSSKHCIVHPVVRSCCFKNCPAVRTLLVPQGCDTVPADSVSAWQRHGAVLGFEVEADAAYWAVEERVHDESWSEYKPVESLWSYQVRILVARKEGFAHKFLQCISQTGSSAIAVLMTEAYQCYFVLFHTSCVFRPMMINVLEWKIDGWRFWILLTFCSIMSSTYMYIGFWTYVVLGDSSTSAVAKPCTLFGETSQFETLCELSMYISGWILRAFI